MQTKKLQHKERSFASGHIVNDRVISIWLPSYRTSEPFPVHEFVFKSLGQQILEISILVLKTTSNSEMVSDIKWILITAIEIF